MDNMAHPTRLLNRNFVLLWQGQLVSQIGNQAFMIAMAFWIKHTTGSASLMGLLMMVGQLPSVLLSPVAGVVADRFRRRRIIIVSDVLRGLAVILLAAFMFLTPDRTDSIVVALFICVTFLSIVGSFFRPAISAAIPDLVPSERLSAANSMNQASMQLSTFLGQGAGGILFRILGAPLLFLIDGITYLASALSESFIDIPYRPPEDTNGAETRYRRYKRQIVEGFRYIWGRPGLRTLILAAAFLNFFMIPILVLMPFYVEDFLHATPDWYGFIIAGFGIGALLGYLWAGGIRISGQLRSVVMVFSLIMQSALLGSLGFTDSRLVALVILMVCGTLNGFLNINIATIVQLSTPSEIRGRVFSLLSMVTGGLSPLAMGLSGIIADLIDQNVPLLYILCGAITVALSIAISFSRSFRSFLAWESPDKTDQKPSSA